jgi:pimeloyl-ACP methyl ester carboxylesterase
LTREPGAGKVSGEKANGEGRDLRAEAIMTGDILKLGEYDGLYYEYDPPTERGLTFVFVNALTGNTGTWQADIGPTLRTAGYGTLAYNFRGQADSPFSPGIALDQSLIIEDLKRLLEAVGPPRPVLVGLSIGGLFAMRAYLAGAPAEGLALVNTLRKSSPRLDWINAAMARAARVGGLRLVMDMYMPLLVNEERLVQIRGDFLTEDAYQPIDPDDGHFSLLAHARHTDWDVPYERVEVPTLVVTGVRDRLFYDREDVVELTARLPKAKILEMKDAGHLIPLERPTALSAALIAFAEDL